MGWGCQSLDGLSLAAGWLHCPLPSAFPEGGGDGMAWPCFDHSPQLQPAFLSAQLATVPGHPTTEQLVLLSTISESSAAITS